MENQEDRRRLASDGRLSYYTALGCLPIDFLLSVKMKVLTYLKCRLSAILLIVKCDPS